MILHSPSRAGALLLSGFFGSCLVGFVTYGGEILNPQMAAFQFVTSGLISSALAVAVVADRRRALWVVAGVALVVFLAAMRPTTGVLLLRDLIYIPTLVASVWLSLAVGPKLVFTRVGRVLAWGIVFALCHFAEFGILTFASGEAFNWQVAYAATRVGGLVGVGVGLGVILAAPRGCTAVRSAH